LLPGCHDIKCSALSHPFHHNGLKPLKQWDKINVSPLKLFCQVFSYSDEKSYWYRNSLYCFAILPFISCKI
jgi:hypothetical protein